MKINFFQTTILLVLVTFLSAHTASIAAAQSDSTQWAKWRGSNDNGVVENQKTVSQWSESENVLWKTEIPGRGHSTPIIVGDRIYLTTADKSAETQSVLCFDRNGGKELWNTTVNTGNLNPKIHQKNTHASPSLAFDGERLFALFNNNDQNQMSALNTEGEILWQRHIAKFKTQFPFGSGSSPIVHDGVVFVPNEANTECAIICLDPKTGDEVRRIDRGGKFSSYSTPVIAEVGGRTQLLISGGAKVSSYDPKTGEELWSVPTKWQVSCGTMVWDGDMVFASGGFPAQQTLAINAKTGELVWDKPVKFYEQSMLAHDGRLYGLSDSAVVYGWNAQTGEELFKQRFDRPVSASPILVGENIYFTSEKGNTLVIKAGTDELEEVSRNKLSNSSFASFAVADNKIYARVGFGKPGNVQEFLYCLGKE